MACLHLTTPTAVLHVENFLSEEYTRIAEERLGVVRTEIDESLLSLMSSTEHRLPQENIAFPAKHPRPTTPRLQNRRNQLNLEMI